MVEEKNLSKDILSMEKTILRKNSESPHTYSIIKNRASWSVSYLKILGFVTNEYKRSYWQITKLGLESYPVEPMQCIQRMQQIGKLKREDADEEPQVVTTEKVTDVDEAEEWRSIILAKLLALEPKSFEQFCGQFLREIGFEDVEVTQPTKDGGFDASAILRHGILSTRALIECKRYKHGNNVPVGTIQQLRGTMKGKHVDKGIIFTTSDFTKEAYKCAKDVGDIELICGEEICNLMKKHEFGVKIEMIPRIVVNENFIEKF